VSVVCSGIVGKQKVCPPAGGGVKTG